MTGLVFFIIGFVVFISFSHSENPKTRRPPKGVKGTPKESSWYDYETPNEVHPASMPIPKPATPTPAALPPPPIKVIHTPEPELNPYQAWQKRNGF